MYLYYAKDYTRGLMMVSTHVDFQLTRCTKTTSRTHHIRTASSSREYACGRSKYQIDENISRTHHIRTVSRSREYACGLSKYQLDENISRTHHIRTVSRSCEYACVFSNYQIE